MTRALVMPPELESGEMTPGKRLGRYELVIPIGIGGMAQVWAARQRAAYGFEKLVAIKLIRAERTSDPSIRAMFLDEAAHAARIRHANVVEVTDLGEDEGVVYQVMPLIEGATLSTLLGRCSEPETRLPAGVAIRIVCDALRGLDAAHELRDEDGEPLHLVHRDVSPQNILVGMDGVARLADFGIAKALARPTDDTCPGDLKGKLRYMAPEQFLGAPVTPRSDLFAAGVVLFEALTGSALYACVNALATRTTSVDPAERLRGCPPAIAAATLRLLESSPERRYASAREAADALEAAGAAAGMLATHQGVATVMAARVGADVAARKQVIRGRRDTASVRQNLAIGHEDTEAVIPVTFEEPVFEAAPRSRKRSGGVTAMAALLMLTACALGGWRVSDTAVPRRALAASPAASPAVSLAVMPAPPPRAMTATPAMPTPTPTPTPVTHSHATETAATEPTATPPAAIEQAIATTPAQRAGTPRATRAEVSAVTRARGAARATPSSSTSSASRPPGAARAARATVETPHD